jgi:hypothetical protein
MLFLYAVHGWKSSRFVPRARCCPYMRLCIAWPSPIQGQHVFSSHPSRDGGRRVECFFHFLQPTTTSALEWLWLHLRMMWVCEPEICDAGGTNSKQKPSGSRGCNFDTRTLFLFDNAHPSIPNGATDLWSVLPRDEDMSFRGATLPMAR